MNNQKIMDKINKIKLELKNKTWVDECDFERKKGFNLGLMWCTVNEDKGSIFVELHRLNSWISNTTTQILCERLIGMRSALLWVLRHFEVENTIND